MSTDRKKNQNLLKERFQELLEQLFQFDSADLDFGIYRIMNYKREQIRKFIHEELTKKVDGEIKNKSDRTRHDLIEKRRDCERRVRKTLGDDAFDAQERLIEDWHTTIIGKEWLALSEQTEKAMDLDALTKAAYDHLYNFFSRYYEDGDFMSKRRYGAARYAVPYNGEEVMLYWANKDQYYIKTGEHFAKYEFRAGKSGDIRVRFELREADTEQDNRQKENRYFFPVLQEINWTDREFTLPFHYRPLRPSEREEYKGNNIQDRIQEQAIEKLRNKDFLAAIKQALLAEVGKESREEKENKKARKNRKNKEDKKSKPVSLLAKHMQRYVRRNTSDYFIHKDLGHFLRQELDFYLKSEFLNAHELAEHGTRLSGETFLLFGIMRNVGNFIIDFLEQIEKFQKNLWEKRKFILETHYCVAMHTVPNNDDLRKAIIANDSQWKEWQELGMLSKEIGKKERDIHLKENGSLMIDTRHFEDDFKDQLLACFDDIDDLCGGVLIHGENFQGLNTLAEKYREQVKCIYIDPPYNTSSSKILYKNDYKHAAWLTLMANRILLSRSFLKKNGLLMIAIDDEELYNLLSMMNMEWGRKHWISTITVVHNTEGRPEEHVAPAHEYMALYAKEIDAVEAGKFLRTPEELKKRYPLEDDKGRYGEIPLRRTGLNSLREDSPFLFFPFVYKPDTEELKLVTEEENFSIYGKDRSFDDDFLKKLEAKYLQAGWTFILPIDNQNVYKNWRWGYKKSKEGIQSGELYARATNGRVRLFTKGRLIRARTPTSIWQGAKYDASSHGTTLLQNILGSKKFSFPKSIHTVVDALRVGLAENKWCMDYFAGSGTTAHAVINLNREDGGKRKFILMEVNDYFDTALLPRIKKVVYAPKWRYGEPVEAATQQEIKNAPHLIKYHRLESYEDSLDNIQFEEDNKQLQYDDYVPKYVLQWESRHCATRLATEKLKEPFNYELRLNGGASTNSKEKRVDLAETFNYLIGMHVRTRHVLQDGDRRYLVYRGDIGKKDTLVIWRNTANWKEDEKAGNGDFRRDARFIKENILKNEKPRTLYVNDDSIVEGAQSLDPIFKERMFARLRAS